MDDPQVTAWARSGAMALTGGPGARRLGPPDGMVPALHAIADRLTRATAALGDAVVVDPIALLGERAAFTRFEPQGSMSCGGSTRLLRGADGWLAATLARADDIDLVPAWFELDVAPVDAWTAVTDAVASRSAAEVVDRGVLLGLPVALLPGTRRTVASTDLPVRRSPVGDADRPEPVAALADTLVVDLSGLWAGPLAGGLLADAGARVVKVESSARPDGARLGPRGFFELLNGRKEQVALDLHSPEGVAQLRTLIGEADVVIEASRPRALEQLGIHALDEVARGPRVWASITGHGRTGGARERVAFGDDAAVAGGLVCWDGDEPVFCADAVADPLTGLVAATAIVEALAQGTRCLLDLAMARVAGHFAGPTLPHSLPASAMAPPRARSRT